MSFNFKYLFQPLFVFYVLVVYIFASFIWWSMLHVQKNQQTFQDQKMIMELQYEKSGLPKDAVLHSPQYTALQKNLQTQNMMIFGEGIVFLILLFIGTYKIHAGFRKELVLNRQQRNFLLSITHELKSPIASIKLALQTMYTRNLSPNQQERLLQNSLKDTERLQNLVNNLLLAAKLDNQTVTFAYEQQNISNLLQNIADKFTINVGIKRTFHIDLTPELYIKGDRTALSSIFHNLIENAIKYSIENDAIIVKSFVKNQQVIVQVSDTGIGIPDKEKKNVFKKFYRIGNEDTRKTKGTGLGLFIVQELVELHGGHITLKNNQPKGTTFQVNFPKTTVKAIVPKESQASKNIPLNPELN